MIECFFVAGAMGQHSISAQNRCKYLLCAAVRRVADSNMATASNGLHLLLQQSLMKRACELSYSDIPTLAFSLHGNLSVVLRATWTGVRPHGVHLIIFCRWLQAEEIPWYIFRVGDRKLQKSIVTGQREAQHSVCEEDLSRWASYQRRMESTVSHLDL